MKSNAFRRYYIGLLASLLLVSAYPIYMGISVVVDMIQNGTVYAEDYPKYIIPYTPIALALLLGSLARFDEARQAARADDRNGNIDGCLFPVRVSSRKPCNRHTDGHGACADL